MKPTFVSALGFLALSANAELTVRILSAKINHTAIPPESLPGPFGPGDDTLHDLMLRHPRNRPPNFSPHNHPSARDDAAHGRPLPPGPNNPGALGPGPTWPTDAPALPLPPLTKRGGGGNVSHSDSWCGVAHHVDARDPFRQVSATLTAPVVDQRPGNSTPPQHAAAWVGLWGTGCAAAPGRKMGLVQAGLASYEGGNAAAWVEWYPAPAIYLPGMPVGEREAVFFNVTLLDEVRAKITINNVARGNAIVYLMTNENSPCCATEADWMVEYVVRNSTQTLPGLKGVVQFDDCQAKTRSGVVMDIDNATMVDVHHGKTICAPKQYGRHVFHVMSPSVGSCSA